VEIKRTLLLNTLVEPLHLIVVCVRHTVLKQSGTTCRKDTPQMEEAAEYNYRE